MINKMYSVFDEKAVYFMPPFPCKTDGEAIRVFGFAVNDGQSSLSQIATDVVLYRVGEFDDSTGNFVACTPVPLSRGNEHIMAKLSPISGQTLLKEGEDEVL